MNLPEKGFEKTPPCTQTQYISTLHPTSVKNTDVNSRPTPTNIIGTSSRRIEHLPTISPPQSSCLRLDERIKKSDEVVEEFVRPDDAAVGS